MRSITDWLTTLRLVSSERRFQPKSSLLRIWASFGTRFQSPRHVAQQTSPPAPRRTAAFASPAPRTQDARGVLTHAKGFAGLIATLTASFALTAGTAQATPSYGVTATVISKETSPTREIVRAEITLQPGASTGWHYHDGQVSGAVEEGTLSHFDSTCKSDGTYHAGDHITEDSGPGYVHIGQNRGTAPVVLEVTYVNPIGKPLSEDAPNPGCSFQ